MACQCELGQLLGSPPDLGVASGPCVTPGQLLLPPQAANCQCATGTSPDSESWIAEAREPLVTMTAGDTAGLPFQTCQQELRA